MVQHYLLDENKLLEVAKQNTVSKSHFECFPLDAVMKNLCFGTEITPVMDMGPGLYCLTNRSKMNGASILAIPELMHQVLQNASEPAYIIPSSIHEVLVFVGEMNVSDLRQRVCDVNATQVPPEDILSNNVYVFDHEAMQLKIAE